MFPELDSQTVSRTKVKKGVGALLNSIQMWLFWQLSFFHLYSILPRHSHLSEFSRTPGAWAHRCPHLHFQISAQSPWHLHSVTLPQSKEDSGHSEHVWVAGPQLWSMPRSGSVCTQCAVKTEYSKQSGYAQQTPVSMCHTARPLMERYSVVAPQFKKYCFGFLSWLLHQ